MELLPIGLGLALLTLGRRLYWLFVAGAGFVLGYYAARQILQIQNDWLALGIGVAVGLFGASLVTTLQKGVLTVAGFLAGAGGTLALSNLLKLDLGPYWWVICLVVGALGVLLLQAAFEVALVLLSSYAGATLVMNNIGNFINIDSSLMFIVFLALVIIGVIIQATVLKPKD